LTPQQFLSALKKGSVASTYLFVGPEAWQRRRCKQALVDQVLPSGADGETFVRHDLSETSLVEVLEDARSLSLFAPRRVIWVSAAEAALPRGRGGEEGEGGRAATAELRAYVEDPTPGVVLVFDCSRYELEGEDKARVQRVRKFYDCIEAVVEFAPLDSGEARRLAQELAQAVGLRISPAALQLVVECCAGDGLRLEAEIEKLALFACDGRMISEAEVTQLVSSAQTTTVFALVAAIARRDVQAALEALEMLVREGEYLPLALAFLATQFRLALAGHEAGLRSGSQVLGYFSKLGIPMWPSRAEQIAQTMQAFAPERLRRAIQRVYETDLALRDTRPDDRTVVERLAVSLL
jgi:DNA polymerase-3 subunit delta